MLLAHDAERREVLTATDMVVLMGEAPDWWGVTERDVWLHKKGYSRADIDSVSTALGHAVEPPLLTEYLNNHHTGPDVIGCEVQAWAKSDKYPLGATSDTLLSLADATIMGLELKSSTSDKTWGGEELPMRVVIQSTVSMIVHNVSRWAIFIALMSESAKDVVAGRYIMAMASGDTEKAKDPDFLFKGVDVEFKLAVIEYDDELAQRIISRACAWWDMHVTADIAPVEQDAVQPNAGEIVMAAAGSKADKIGKRLESIGSQIKAMEEEEAKLKAELFKEVPDTIEVVKGSGWGWKRIASSKGGGVDWKGLGEHVINSGILDDDVRDKTVADYTKPRVRYTYWKRMEIK